MINAWQDLRTTLKRDGYVTTSLVEVYFANDPCDYKLQERVTCFKWYRREGLKRLRALLNFKYSGFHCSGELLLKDGTVYKRKTDEFRSKWSKVYE